MIKLTQEHKELFDKWLLDRERELEENLERIRSLRKQTGSNTRPQVHDLLPSNAGSGNQSMTAKTLNAFKHLGDSLTSVQIIDWLIENDNSLKHKNRRAITKAVTSKLAILVDKSQIEKRVVNGKYLYSVKMKS